MTRDEFMEIAWRDFIVWAGGEPKMIAAFEADTGVKAPAPAKSPLDAMIDKATGAHEAWAAEFTRWVTVNHWGLDEAPQSYRDMLATQGTQATTGLPAA